jgi:type IV pilus assembly protein PilX
MVNRMHSTFGLRGPAAARGAVLITALVFLVVLLMIVVSIMRAGTLEERMASNARDRQIALQAAEAVSRDAATVLFGTGATSPIDPFDLSQFTSACTNALCGVPSGTPLWKSPSQWTTSGKTRTFASASSKLKVKTDPDVFLPDASQPRYFVELIGFEGGQGPHICPKIIYRVTARGQGSDNATVFVETMYRHRPHSYVDGSCGGT